MSKVHSLTCNLEGIVGQTKTHGFRQVLLLNNNTLEEFKLSPGDLRENIILECDDLYQLPSGTKLTSGELQLRLTYHCEPCKKISGLCNPKDIIGKRGYLATVHRPGAIEVGNFFVNEGIVFESIPYSPSQRIEWYLNSIKGPIFASELVSSVALQSSYCRALPRILAKLGERYQQKVKFKHSSPRK